MVVVTRASTVVSFDTSSVTTLPSSSAIMSVTSGATGLSRGLSVQHNEVNSHDINLNVSSMITDPYLIRSDLSSKTSLSNTPN